MVDEVLYYKKNKEKNKKISFAHRPIEERHPLRWWTFVRMQSQHHFADFRFQWQSRQENSHESSQSEMHYLRQQFHGISLNRKPCPFDDSRWRKKPHQYTNSPYFHVFLFKVAIFGDWNFLDYSIFPKNSSENGTCEESLCGLWPIDLSPLPLICETQRHKKKTRLILIENFVCFHQNSIIKKK